jgi:BirA family biotin operon repressor/biotin-[acetyl-CoA-carboxylase] ligase
LTSTVPHRLRSIVLDEVDSTNTEAFAHARAGERGPLWIVARRQTQGRGRSGRQWLSEPGNLYASLLQTLACPQSVVHQLSLLTGVAVIDAIRTAAGAKAIAPVRLKWPNDVLIGEAKCAGILPESHSSANGASITAVIGIGINLAWHPAGLGRPSTCLAEQGLELAPETMLGFVADAMQQWLAAWDNGRGFAAVRAAWRERGGPVGEPVSVDTGHERMAGTFLDLDGDGALLMRDPTGAVRRVTYGEVTLGPPADGRAP